MSDHWMSGFLDHGQAIRKVNRKSRQGQKRPASAKRRGNSDQTVDSAIYFPNFVLAFMDFYGRITLTIDSQIGHLEAGSQSHQGCRFNIPSSHRYGPAV